jgi:hypothetical protein
MAIKVTGYFPNKGNHTFTKDPIIKLEIKQLPMGLLDTICHISTDVEQITPSMFGTSTYSLIVHSFTIHNINRESLSFDELIVDPYDKLLFAVQNFIMDGFESDYPDLTFENYVTPTPEVTPTSTVEPTED